MTEDGKNYIKTFSWVCLFALVLRNADAQAVTPDAAVSKPNIVLVVLDNFGWGELGVYGGGELHGAPTPRIDTLAEQGLRLTNFNVETVCTMSRAALLTGRYGIRTGALYPVRKGIGATTKAQGLIPWEETIAEVLAAEGYTSGLFGKWHLGDRPGRLPTDQGFDEWYGIADNSTNIVREELHPLQTALGLPNGQYVLEGSKDKEPNRVKPFDQTARALIDKEVTDSAIGFVNRMAAEGRPFFAYIPYIETHRPSYPHPDFKGKSGNGVHADVLMQVDHYIGRLLDTLDSLDISKNTIFILTADNGSPHSGPWDAGDAQGVFSAKEGALRVPFIVRWPGHIAADSQSNEIVHQMDLLPTLSSITAAALPQDRIIDGLDQAEFFLGKQKNSNRQAFVIYAQEKVLGIKWKNWKVITHPEKIKQYAINSVMNMEEFVIIHDLLSDRKEETFSGPWWVLSPAGEVLRNHLHSLETHPPVPVGAPDEYQPK